MIMIKKTGLISVVIIIFKALYVFQINTLIIIVHVHVHVGKYE